MVWTLDFELKFIAFANAIKVSLGYFDREVKKYCHYVKKLLDNLLHCVSCTFKGFQNYHPHGLKKFFTWKFNNEFCEAIGYQVMSKMILCVCFLFPSQYCNWSSKNLK